MTYDVAEIKARMTTLTDNLLESERFQQLLDGVIHDEYYTKLTNTGDKGDEERLRRAKNELRGNVLLSLHFKADFALEDGSWEKDEPLTLNNSPQLSLDFFKRELRREIMQKIEEEFPLGQTPDK
ncbi:MAG: hypothetical protein COV36_01655 [Alphaproteobacteria bacterium CG11_big_fil_rev_8_21_14_0_20_44_7]|nr:MAG: hypothetical protein COV36_01655 [Alphaproteobacteria bacterium CG11_big_fil_rev_8_21_14_0_20_44_7]